jgi:hypothetical protein
MKICGIKLIAPLALTLTHCVLLTGCDGPDLPTLSLRGIAAPWVTSPDPRLTGTWVAEEGELCSHSAPCRFQFSAKEGRVKLIFDAANKDYGCVDFDVATARIGSTEYFDLKLDSFCGPGGKDRGEEVLASMGSFAAVHFVALHSIWKVEISDTRLIWTAIATPASAELDETEWFHDDSPKVFVGTSDALATWLQRFGEQAENKPYFVAHRVGDGSPPATGEQPETSGVDRSVSTN